MRSEASRRWFFNTGKVVDVPVRYGKSLLETTSEARRIDKAAGIQLDKPVPLHADHISEDFDDIDDAHASHI